jgi:hypothetical protein
MVYHPPWSRTVHPTPFVTYTQPRMPNTLSLFPTPHTPYTPMVDILRILHAIPYSDRVVLLKSEALNPRP